MKKRKENEHIFVFNDKARVKAQNKEIILGLRELMDILFEGRGCYELWWTYLQFKSKSENLPVMLKFKNYFETSGYAYVSNLVLSLHKLYDHRRDVWNIESLVKDAKSLLEDKERIEIQQLIFKAKAIWKKVTILRSNLFAHRNNELSRSGVYKIAKITPNEFRDLTVFSLTILNYIAVKVYEPVRKFEDIEARDMDEILGILRERI